MNLNMPHAALAQRLTAQLSLPQQQWSHRSSFRRSASSTHGGANKISTRSSNRNPEKKKPQYWPKENVLKSWNGREVIIGPIREWHTTKPKPLHSVWPGTSQNSSRCQQLAKDRAYYTLMGSTAIVTPLCCWTWV